MKFRTAVAALAALVASACACVPARAEQGYTQASENSSAFTARFPGSKQTWDNISKFEINAAFRTAFSNSYGTSCSAITAPYPYQLCVDATMRAVRMYSQPVGGGAFSWNTLFNITNTGTFASIPGSASYIATGTGAASRLASDKLGEQVSVQDYGAKCDGITEDGPAFNRALAAAKIAIVPAEGCSGTYLINTTILLPGSHSLKFLASGTGATASILTTAAVDTISVTGDSCSIEGLNATHTGASGKIIELGTRNYCSISDSVISGTHVTATTSLVHLTGSINTFKDVRITNNRPNSGAAIDQDSGNPASIVNRYVRVTIGGSGPGLLVHDSTNLHRPEGIYLDQYHYFGTANSLFVGAVNGLYSTNSTYDVGTGIYLKPAGQGVDDVVFIGGYVATSTIPTTGSCIQIDGSGGASVARLVLIGAALEYCGYGIANTNGGLGTLTVQGAQVNSVTIGYNLQGSARVSIGGGSTCSTCTFNFILSDGASGGPFAIGNNQWDSGGSLTLTETDPTKFTFSDENVGMKLAGFASATTGTISSTTCTALAIPHHLVLAPSIDRITLAARVVTGAFTNIAPSITSVDGTNINVSVCATLGSNGTIRVNARASL